MKRYRCKHAVEAMRWNGAAWALREWHEQKTGELLRMKADGIASVLLGDAWHEIAPGEWLLWSSDEFLVMDDEQFRDTYEEAP